MNLYNPQSAKLSLLPILLFIGLFLGTGLTLQTLGIEFAFQQLPGQVAIIPALILAVVLNRKPVSIVNAGFLVPSGLNQSFLS